ncbi:uncharacterized protein LOC143896019 [Temnothorax americanus]|uniref:uncharacterized protein LOC143896019 n=1 Tax=Temnothorax americanus TaxID=1964332 RepID=UPI004068CC1C
MNLKKLKHVSEISSRQFCRRVHNTMMEIIDKIENRATYESISNQNNNNVPLNSVSSNATSDTVCEEDTASNLPILCNDLHTDNPSDSDNELLNHGMCGYEENERRCLATLHSSLEESEDSDQDEATSEVENFLSNWTVKHLIKNIAVTDLLSHLKKYPYFSTLPKDARTLLHTPRKCNTIDIEPGKYCHFGIANIMDTILNDDLKRQKCKLQGVQIAVGIDGLPLCKSSSSTFWPILGSVLPNGSVFIIGAYHGNFKPKSSNLFLRNFVHEASFLYENGIEIDGIKVPFSIKYFVMDAPAKSYVLNVKGHTGYNSCTKCHVKGLSDHRRVYFLEKNAQKRTNEEFRLHADFYYHLDRSELEILLDIDLIKCIPLDYMHLICLGVMRKLMYLWVHNDGKKRKWQLSANQIQHMSDVLLKIKLYVPSEFQRKPRSLIFLKQWKATEYRQLLFYTGLVVLRYVLREDLYQHFVQLHVAVKILSCSDLHEHLNYAQFLLEHFVESFSLLYNNYLVSHNVHGLIHITEDVKHLGNIENFSAFRFENFMHFIKTLIRKSETPLQQLFNRYNEIYKRYKNDKHNITNLDKLVPVQSSAYNDVVPDGCKNPLYSKAVCSNFTLSIKEDANNCCGLEDGSIVIVQQIAWHVQLNDYIIIGKRFLRKQNFYTTPCESSLLDTYVVSKLALSENTIWPLFTVNRKFFIIPYRDDKYVVLPLLHNDSD